MITQDLDQITNIASRETVLNHYAKETNSKLSSPFSIRTVVGRTNSSSGVSCEFNDDFNDDDDDDDIYESIYNDDTYLQTTEQNEMQTSTKRASGETMVESTTEPVTKFTIQTGPQPVTQPLIQTTEEATRAGLQINILQQLIYTACTLKLLFTSLKKE